jgi:hypothetical protein
VDPLVSDDDEPPTIALIVEAEDDARTAKFLVDRQLRAAADWLHDANLDDHRGWQVIRWRAVPDMCKEHGVATPHGRFEGGRAPDAHAARRALLLLSKLGRPAAVVLLRDADKENDRRRGLEQGRSDDRVGFKADRVAIGLAVPTREAWHLVGFEPTTPAEFESLKAERDRLGFDPTRTPQELTNRRGKRPIKPVLERLTGGDPDREQHCLDCDNERLRERGRDCGLSEFLDELDARVVPAFA